jgi:DNA-binding MarR family transcriptional regulator
MTDRTPDAAAIDVSLDRLSGRYSEAFPEADINAFRAHFSIVRSGVRLSQAVGQFLDHNFGLNSARYGLLRALYFTEGHRLRQTEVARAMDVTAPNVTQLIDALERDGLVERVTSDTDRRVTYAQLTRAGTALCAKAIPAMGRFMQETMAPFSSKEMAQLARLLARFRNHLAQLDDTTT